MRIAVVGTRDYPCLQAVRQVLQDLPSGCELLTGDARGVDAEVRSLAQRLGHALTVYRADWQTYGKSAGPRRNAELLAHADLVLVFWAHQSPGTWDSIRRAMRLNLPFALYNEHGQLVCYRDFRNWEDKHACLPLRAV